ncbi:uncharacterized protein LOC131014000 [Salvia miltiorrhiza]|uniref:uncharacterized protein LOC131014000 n=1 Tax=Salvia miltiorrhiza TaxID=226208 RepID=UPI0025AC2859|nr:uncharacterized protein LOC131014000 [Salvia miltiorrhiza]
MSAAVRPVICGSPPVTSNSLVIGASSSSIDFNFCQEDSPPPTADELFFDGKILPIQISNHLAPPSPSSPPLPPSQTSAESKKNLALCQSTRWLSCPEILIK